MVSCQGHYRVARPRSRNDPSAAMPPSPQDCNLDEGSSIRFQLRRRELEGRAHEVSDAGMPFRRALGRVEHLPELQIGKVGKLFSKNWSLPGQEQQLSDRRQIAYLIRGE